MIPPRSVLIVDRSEETREVLSTALERRGLRTYSASRPHRGLELARQHRPDLIVLDLEMEGEEDVCAPFAEQSEAAQTTLVLLGSVRCKRQRPAIGEFVPKPYHYGPLVRRIEELLMGSGRRCARAA